MEAFLVGTNQLCVKLPPLNTTKTVIAGGLNESGVYYGGSKLQHSDVLMNHWIFQETVQSLLCSVVCGLTTPVCVNPRRESSVTDSTSCVKSSGLLYIRYSNCNNLHKKDQKESSFVTDKKERV